VALVAVALAFTDWALSLRPGVTEANVRRIKSGMTLAEVEAHLGPLGAEQPGLTPGLFQTLAWGGKGGAAVISFDRDGKVSETEFVPSDPTRRGPLSRLRAWIGR
jgi:hypothetical protein